ncbi:MAG: OmpA family protein [Ignavibacterium sp.]|jgi:flagellar motor protein MotB|nr:OmpA family protein [Ignavibacterium sp.]
MFRYGVNNFLFAADGNICKLVQVFSYFAHNMKLSKDRAAAVVSYLVSKGISQPCLTSDGVGQLCPVTTNADEEGRQKNRRVEIVLK